MELYKEDLKWCLRRLPRPVFEMMKKHPGDIFLAGGFIRACIANEKPCDVDLFTTNKEKAKLYAELFAVDGKIIETDNAFTIIGKIKPPIQIIHKWVFEKPEDILPSFDFTIARAVIWYHGAWKGICDDRFYIDLAAKRLTYCSPKRIEYVGGSLLRVLKFYQRGYRIPLNYLAAVIARLMTGIRPDAIESMTEPQDLEEKWAFVITGLLHEVDPQVDLTHEAHLPSTVEDITEESLGNIIR